MSLIAKYRFNQGTLLDLSGNGHHGTLTPGTGGFRRGDRGMGLLFDGANTTLPTLLTANDAFLNGFAISAWINPASVGEIAGRIVDKSSNTSAGNGFSLNMLTNKVGFTVNGGTTINAAASSITYGNDYHILALVAADGTVSFYINNVLSGTPADAGDLADITTANPLTIGNRSTATDRTFDGLIRAVDILSLDEADTDDKRAAIYNKGIPGSIYVPKRKFFYPAPRDLSRKTGLVGAWNMEATGGKVVDISGNGNDGVITGALDTEGVFGRALAFNGVADKVVLGNIGDVKSIALRCKLSSTTEAILEGAANAKRINAVAGTLGYTDFDNAFVNGVDTNTVVAGQWLNIVITSTTAVDMSAVTLALNNVTYGALTIDECLFYDYELSAQEIKDHNNKYSAQVTIKEDFKDAGADGVVKLPEGWNVGTGDYKIEEVDYVL